MINPELKIEIPDVVWEEDSDDTEEAITETLGPTLEERTETTQQNIGLSHSTGVSSKLAGVQYTPGTNLANTSYMVRYGSDSDSDHEKLPQKSESASDSNSNSDDSERGPDDDSESNAKFDGNGETDDDITVVNVSANKDEKPCTGRSRSKV